MTHSDIAVAIAATVELVARLLNLAAEHVAAGDIAELRRVNDILSHQVLRSRRVLDAAEDRVRGSVE